MIISPDDDVTDFEDSAQVALAWERARKRWAKLLPRRRQAFVMVGLPGAGKSTWAKANAHGVLTFDGCFTRSSARAQVLRPAVKAGVSVTFVWVTTDVETCIARDKVRLRTVGAPVIRAIARCMTTPRSSQGARVRRVTCVDPPP